MLQTSNSKASIGRIVHLFCPTLWNGPQPAIVVSDPWPGAAAGQEPDPATQQTVAVNVFVSGDRKDTLAYFRASPSGNTFFGVSLFDPLTEDERLEAVAKFAGGSIDQPLAWAEWPPRD